MAELPAELIHLILANITDHITMINLALTSRLYYTTAMPVILAEESRYVRDVMIPGKYLSIYEFPSLDARLPPASLDSPAGPFTGTIRMIDFMPWQDFKSLCCIHRLVLRAKYLERITMNLLPSSYLSWLIAYINVCVGRPGVFFTLNGGKGKPSIVDTEALRGPNPMGSPKLPFVHPPYLSAMPSVSSSTTEQNNFSRFYQQLKSTATLNRAQAGSQTHSNSSGLIAPRITGLKLVNKNLFSSPLAGVVRTLAASEHITSFAFVNARNPNSPSPHFGNDGEAASSTAIFAALNLPSLTQLTIEHNLLTTRGLIHFLARHPLIIELYLDLHYKFRSDGISSLKSQLIDWHVPTSPPKRFMPNLVRLGGNAHWVLPFVRWRQSKDRDGGDAGHLPALQELELRIVTKINRSIGPTTWHPPLLQPWEIRELNAVYDVLFCVNAPSLGSSVLPWKASSSKPSKRQNPDARTCIRVLVFEPFSCSHFIEWLILQAAKRQTWPVFSDGVGATIEILIIPEWQTFSIVLKTRAELLNALGRWCPELGREIVTDRRARRWHTDESGDLYSKLFYSQPNRDIPVEYAVEEAFTQYWLERVIWHTFPNLQTLQIETDKMPRPPADPTSTKPIGL